MAQQEVQWFPGHMARARRVIGECLPQVDIVFELLDARIPYSSRNPEIKAIIGVKPKLILLNKASLADGAVSRGWVKHFAEEGEACLITDCRTGEGMKAIAPRCREILAAKVGRYADRGMSGRALKAMVVGVPNVGKSSLINYLSGARNARVEDRPGVTLKRQWISTGAGLDLLDMPGILWPKFSERRVGIDLAITGAVRDEVVDAESVAAALCQKLAESYPALLCACYKLAENDLSGSDEERGYAILKAVGKKRGFLISGGEVDTARAAKILLDEFRAGKLGRITLEDPPRKVSCAEVSPQADSPASASSGDVSPAAVQSDETSLEVCTTGETASDQSSPEQKDEDARLHN